jgi:2-amino-4-hydroxy-6-hydroxymethyldihydropteridine diphosphokinase
LKFSFKPLFLATGSNQGNCFATLMECNRLIAKNIGNIVQISPLYLTKAWGKTDQPDFLNQVLRLETPFTPLMVFYKLQAIEKQLGRVRYEKWGPRSIDIDILFYDKEIIKTPVLNIPHPDIPNRNFVLKPLMDVAATWKHPVLQLPIKELWARRTDTLPIRKY